MSGHEERRASSTSSNVQMGPGVNTTTHRGCRGRQDLQASSGAWELQSPATEIPGAQPWLTRRSSHTCLGKIPERGPPGGDQLQERRRGAAREDARATGLACPEQAGSPRSGGHPGSKAGLATWEPHLTPLPAFCILHPAPVSQDKGMKAGARS